jgi:type III pantothenate kinase
MNEITQIPHVLACDVGNSAVKIAHVHGEQCTGVTSFRVGELAALGAALKELWDTMPPGRKLVAASVNPAALKALEAAAMEHMKTPVLVVGRELPLPMPTELAHPEQVGVDRLCAAVAAYDHLGAACVVGDFGTAITIDCVSPEGVFKGGAIMPGLSMSARALHEHTAQLPEVELAPPDWVYGRDTRQAIVGGLVHGARGALRELVEAYATDLGVWPVVIITGGDAKLIAPDASESELVQAIVPDLTLRGVAIAYYRTLLK